MRNSLMQKKVRAKVEVQKEKMKLIFNEFKDTKFIRLNLNMIHKTLLSII